MQRASFIHAQWLDCAAVQAGHAMEPEVAIAFAGLSHANTCIVLAGDPQQLGPIVRSGAAKKAKHANSAVSVVLTTS